MEKSPNLVEKERKEEVKLEKKMEFVGDKQGKSTLALWRGTFAASPQQSRAEQSSSPSKPQRNLQKNNNREMMKKKELN